MHRRATDHTRLNATGICKRFGSVTVLDEAQLRVEAGEIVALVGENGAGKSTMLRVCAGALVPDAGQVSAIGQVGWCPQDGGLLDLLTADEHLVMFGRGAGLSRRDALARGHTVLDGLGFSAARGAVVRDLSGGTRQKLNLALAVIAEPSVLLLDEPYQGFDHGTYTNFWDHCRTWGDQGMAIVVVTHLLAELSRVDRVVELRGGRGHVVATAEAVEAAA